ncbi:uncharacterized protein Eint_092060 [Encephalitozoon intestinalis ATCC 50506]|uniref:Uncharacterized protein n=1 Tax=Encephalitozoon intestinalis (strain ATCC 50506) TaxID=876142 RepID=E0S997_ENCIT|nr:uncharacterized protein Eint_092060 [Encephalitozoon intestinalis ATCC 50506]ADM12332.1 hypothetical protein Eint_092060 [Encephalitozoon intestinalis ATCC 50506]UTX46144.1 DUF2463 domain-containing protein [Encephalitozoon intestinalis]
MSSIFITELASTPMYTYHENSKRESYWSPDLYSHLGTSISILIPLLMFLIFGENTLKDNSFIRFLFFAIPLLQLTFLNFCLFSTINNSNTMSIFHSILHSVLKFLLILFSILPFLLIFMFPLLKPENIKVLSSSSLFLLSITYFFFTSLSPIPSTIQFSGSAIDALAGFSLLLIFFLKRNHLLLFHLFLFLFTLFKFLRFKYSPPKNIETTPWRQILFVLIFTVLTVVYLFISLLFFLFITKNLFSLAVKKIL